jgi:hypothetical protein
MASDSTVTIPTAGTATLRIKWSSGNNSPVYTNTCTYTVSGNALGVTTAASAPTVTPTIFSAARGAAAFGSVGTALLAAALGSLLPLFILGDKVDC